MREQLAALKLAVLYGGTSGEREVSLASADTVLGALRDGGYAPLAIDTATARWWQSLDGVDLAFNIQHGRGGEDGVTQGLLAALGVTGTGSGVLASALAMDKIRSKRLWRDAGLPTADFVELGPDTDGTALLATWGRAFVKPACEGSSLGMTRVDDASQFQAALAAAQRSGGAVLAERCIDGPEYTVAILGDAALPVIRIEAAGTFYDYEAKYRASTTAYHVPCGLAEGEVAEVQDLALAAFDVLGCGIWGRVDLMRDADGRFQLLEVNTIPGMTTHSLVPMAARAAGLSLTQLVEDILCLSLDAAGGGA
jgi:D-alanine-D-alanine ligase